MDWSFANPIYANWIRLVTVWHGRTERLAISPHQPDNRFLECAEAALATYLVTGNSRHFPGDPP